MGPLLKIFKQSKSSALTVLGLVVLTALVGGCGKGGNEQGSGEVSDSTGINPQRPTPNEHRLIILHGKSEDLSVVTVNHANRSMTIKNSMAMGGSGRVAGAGAGAGASDQPCLSPNVAHSFDDEYFVVCSLSQDVQVFDAKSHAFKRKINLGNLINPWDIAILNVKKAYVSSFIKDKVLVIDPSRNGNALLHEIDLRKLPFLSDPGKKTLPHPEGMLIHDKKLYVAITNLDKAFLPSGPGYVVVIDTNSNEVLEMIRTNGRNTVSVIPHPDPKMSHLLYFVNAGDYQNPMGYIGDGNIEVYNTRLKTIEANVKVGGAPQEMVIDRFGKAYVSNGKEGVLLKFDTHNNQIETSIDVRKNDCPKSGAAANPSALSYISSLAIDDNHLYLTEFNNNCFMALDLEKHELQVSLTTGDGPEVMFFENESK
jgi:DNA-binding beta-propeller fold protein YncE